MEANYLLLEKMENTKFVVIYTIFDWTLSKIDKRVTSGIESIRTKISLFFLFQLFAISIVHSCELSCKVNGLFA